MWWKWIAWAVLAAVGFSGAYLYWAHFTESGRIDRCLDDGGRWNYEQGKCEGNRSAP